MSYAIDFQGPKVYDHTLPIFKGDTTEITERVTHGLENALEAYVQSAVLHAQQTDNNPKNYRIADVHVVGSGAREHIPDSDLDLLFEVPALDPKSCDAMKVVLGLIFFANRPKNEAVDVFVRQKDAYTERSSVRITDQVQGMLDSYNSRLLQEE